MLHFNSPALKRIPNTTAHSLLSERQARGFHVDRPLLDKVQRCEVYLLTIDSVELFLSLIWLARNDSRLLTPNGESRTLKHVAKRVINQNLTIEALASYLGKPDNIHNPRWFDKCVPIAQSFRYEHFGHIALVEASESEKRGSPTGTYYINDGAHKTLVLT